MKPADGESVTPSGSRAADPPKVGRLRARTRRWETRLSSRWLGRTLLRSARSSTRMELFDRSMTLAAQMFTCVIPLLILFATWMTQRDAALMGEAVAMPEETRSLLEDAVSAAADTTFTLLGLVVVIVSATSLARALTRAFAAIWELPRPQSNAKAGWRWVAAVLALALFTLLARALAAGAGPLPDDGALSVAASLCLDGALALFVPWVLLAGALPTRLLLPGAVVAALAFLVVRPATAEWLPRALESSSDHYGAIGVTFTYLALFYCMALCFLSAAIVGQVIATDHGWLGRWIRGGSGEAAAP